jgi:hypothetical protein
MEQNYLDIYPSNSIARRIEMEPLDLRWIEQLVAHANSYIKLMEHENVDYLEARQGPFVDTDKKYKFLRSQERTRNTKLIMQHLIGLLSKELVFEEHLKGSSTNAFERLKSFTLFNIGLLKAKDVSAAILKEHEKLGLLNETNRWYYRGQIDKNYKNLYTALQDSNRAGREGYLKLFRVLQQLSVFWFSVRSEDPNRVRRSDILIYKLTRFLLSKHQE